MSAPSWQDIFESAREGRLGVDEDAAVAKGALVAELRDRGFSPDFLEEAVEGGELQVVDDSFPPKYELGKRVAPAEDGESGERAAESDNCDGWGEADFTNPESDVWAREWVSRRFWMGRQGKMPFAPWASREHPEVDEDGNARYKWSITDNWTTKNEVDDWVEKDRRVDGYVVLLEKEDDPYTDDPDPYAFVDGDDVRCPETGEVHPEFVELLERLGMTYADISTSGSGVHALYEGALPDDVKQANFQIDTEPWGENEDPPSVEIYDGKHVCVVTGEHVQGTPEHVHEWDEDALDDILDEQLEDADRIDPTEGTDTDAADRLDDYDPAATGAGETTDELNDVFYAVENLTPRDLRLRTKKVGEDATGWEKWDPSTYRQSSGKDSLHSPPGENVFHDQKTGRSFGLLSLYACEQGILSKPWETLEGSDWWAAVESAREDGAPIPEYESADEEEDDGYDDDPTDADVVLDARRAWTAAGNVTPENLDKPTGLETEDDGWIVGGNKVGDVARAVAVGEGLVDALNEPLGDTYSEAYDVARKKYGAPLPEYLTHEDTVTRHDAAFGAIKELSYWHLDEDEFNVEITGIGKDVGGDAVRTLDPSTVDGWRDSESGESVLVFESGTIWDADLGDDGQVIDALRFVAVDAGIVDEPTAVLEGDDFVEAYDVARTEYGAPLPRWEAGTPDVTPVLPEAEDLVDDVEDKRREIDKLRNKVEKLYRETIQSDPRNVDVLRCLPALGKTTSAIKTAADEPTTYLAARKELMHDAEEKAMDAGISCAHLPVFSEERVSNEVLQEAVDDLRERGKDALRDPWSFFEHVNQSSSDIFVDSEDDDVELNRPTCPTAEGEHGEAWALAVHVARELDYTPRDIHERAEAIFGQPLPCQHDDDCEYSEGWDAVSDPDECPELLIGHYTHGHVESARTYYEPDDEGIERSPRVLVLDEFPGTAYSEVFDDDAVEHALWLARSLREDVDDRQDLMEVDLWSDDWVRGWLSNDDVVPETAGAAQRLDARAALFDAVGDASEILDSGADFLKDQGLAEDIRRFVEDPLSLRAGDALEAESKTAGELAGEIRAALEELPPEHGGQGLLDWLDDTVGSALSKASDCESYEVDVDELPVAGELREFVERAVEKDEPDLLRGASKALLGGDDGARELSVWANDGYAHQKAHLLLEAAIRPTEDDDTARIETSQYAFDADRDEDGTTLKHVDIGDKITVLWDRNHQGAEILTPPSRRDGDGNVCPLVGLDATARRRLWQLSLGESVRLRDVHESRQERAEALREVHGLQVVQTSDRVKSYEGDPSGKNLDADVALLEEIEDEFTGVQVPSTRGEDAVQVDSPAVITTKCVRDALKGDDRLKNVVGRWENYGNVKGSNDLGDTNLAALLGCQHYGDNAVERFAALAGEEVDRVGYGDALEYGSDVADEYLGHMREDQVMQAVLRFARGGSGAVVFAHTAALRDDLPVVGKGEVIRSWSDTATQVAREVRRRKTVKVSDVADTVDAEKRHVRRILNEFASAGYLVKHETGEGLANEYTSAREPGAGEVEIDAEIEPSALADPDGEDSSVVYTVDVRVSGVRDTDLPATPPRGSRLPAPNASDGVLVEGDPPE